MSIEHLLILLVVVGFFAPKSLPALGTIFGKTMRGFRDGIAGLRDAEFKKIKEITLKKNDE